MTITTTAKCDAPDCKAAPTVTEPGQWPDPFIVIELVRARGGLSWPTGRYGFCSLTCLSRWVEHYA